MVILLQAPMGRIEYARWILSNKAQLVKRKLEAISRSSNFGYYKTYPKRRMLLSG